MLHGHVVDQLLDEHRFAHARAAEQADLAPAGVGLQQIDDLDARLQNLHGGALLLEGGGLAVDGLHRRAGWHRPAAVDGLPQNVKHTAQGGPAYGDLDGVPRYVHRQPACQPFAGGEHDTADGAVPDMLGHLHHPDLAVPLHGKLFPQPGQLAVGDFHVHHGTGNLRNDPSFQTDHDSFFWRWAFAPADTSVMLWVMAAWRTRLYWRDSSPSSFSALRLALSMAVMRASCSQQKLSIRAL